MRKPDFEQALREAADVLDAATMPPDAERRIRAQLMARRNAHRRWVIPVGVALAAAAILLVTLRRQPPASAPAATAPIATVPAPRPVSLQIGEFAWVGQPGRADVRADQTVAIHCDECTLSSRNPVSTLVVKGDAVLKQELQGVRVVSGSVVIAVAKRPPGAPAHILVSHGTIEIVGTRFTVTQHESAGSVALHEGAIRFHAETGQDITLSPGETLAWPLPAPRIVPPATPAMTDRATHPVARTEPAPADPVTAAPAGPIETLLARVASLRSRRMYEQAADELGAALIESTTSSYAERLSFELGSILTYQLERRTQACAHWHRHLAVYGPGRYGQETEQAQQHLRCDQPDALTPPTGSP